MKYMHTSKLLFKMNTMSLIISNQQTHKTFPVEKTDVFPTKENARVFMACQKN